MKRYIAIYSRYGDKRTEAFDSLADATIMLQHGADHGSLYGHGIYDSEAGAFYLPMVDESYGVRLLDDDDYLIDGVDVQLPIKVAGHYSTFGDD